MRKYLRFDGRLYRLFDVKSQFQTLIEKKLKEVGADEKKLKEFAAAVKAAEKKIEEERKKGGVDWSEAQIRRRFEQLVSPSIFMPLIKG